MINDIPVILIWWLVFLVFGAICFPLTHALFKNFRDAGYIFSKTLGIGLVSYLVFLLAVTKIFPFSTASIVFSAFCLLILNVFIFLRNKLFLNYRDILPMVLLEEVLFLTGIFIWAFIRGHEPNINGLEKFMDFGFINSILKSTNFPPTDMWFPPFSINYYYFGHFITALLTKVSQIPSNISYNLMLATLFSITFVSSFSIGSNLFFARQKKIRASIISGILTAFLVTLAGNLHTLYAFFSAYVPADNPVPFWQLVFQPLTLFSNGYWYPNATRFIPFTIHEFPIYSFVVADLHGHVLDIPFVLLTIALLASFVFNKTLSVARVLLLSLLLSIMYTTNAWDGAIYMLLSALCVVFIVFSNTTLKNKGNMLFQIYKKLAQSFTNLLQYITILIAGFVIFSLPFNFYFKPFVSGIGILCAPKFLTDIKTFGPLLFEADHCTRSPLWMLVILYGLFYFFVAVFLVYIFKKRQELKASSSIFLIFLIFLSTVLIIIPEVIYVKDIYPQHYRANTMFKLTYQAFIMLSLVSAYTIIYTIKKINSFVLYIPVALLLTIVFIYPWFAVFSYYGNLKTYQGLDGTAYLKNRLQDDYQTIQWLNNNIKKSVVVLEANGDSYTDYARISANTGNPTILGWLVHEWLWRGSYEVPAPRIDEVKQIYESKDINLTKALLKKYNVSYVYVGGLEREKFQFLFEEKFETLGDVVFFSGNSNLYKINY